MLCPLSNARSTFLLLSHCSNAAVPVYLLATILHLQWPAMHSQPLSHLFLLELFLPKDTDFCLSHLCLSSGSKTSTQGSNIRDTRLHGDGSLPESPRNLVNRYGLGYLRVRPSSDRGVQEKNAPNYMHPLPTSAQDPFPSLALLFNRSHKSTCWETCSTLAQPAISPQSESDWERAGVEEGQCQRKRSCRLRPQCLQGPVP